MVVLLAIAVTAIVVAACTTVIVRQSSRAAFATAIGGRQGEDAVEVHRRLILEAQRAAASASHRAELLELSMGALTSGVIVTDESGAVLTRNAFAGDVAKRSHEQTLVDATVGDLLQQAVTGVSGEQEVEIFGPPTRTLFVHAVPVTNETRVVGALAIIDDVTEHHRIDKIRRDFVANLSHELRTPVGAASLLAEMLVAEDDAATRKQLTDRLLIETDRIVEAIDDLLELSRIESDTQGYDESFIVQQVVAEAVARTKVSAEASQVEVGALGPAEPIVMIGNRDQLLIALVNLVENAIKYSSVGDSVSVRTRVDEATLSLVVQDTGRGIPSRDIDRIFERFYRVDRSRDSSTGGTGIGLSVVRHVAMNHGGTVDVKSYEGEGSTFTVVLPLVAPQSRPLSEPANELL